MPPPKSTQRSPSPDLGRTIGETLRGFEGVTSGAQEILDYIKEQERKDQEALEDFYRRRDAWKAEVKDRLKHLLPWEKGEKGPRGEWKKVKKSEDAKEEGGKDGV